MTGGLRQVLGLPETNQPEISAGSQEFSQNFRAGLADVNQEMQVVAARGVGDDHQKLDSQRQTLIAAYQTAAPLGDASKNGQVLAAVTKVKQVTSTKAAAINAGFEEWQKREAAFDTAVVKIGELEDANHPKAAAFRNVSETIQTRVNGGDYQKANTAFDQLQPKLNDIASDPQLAALLNPKTKGPTSGLNGLDSGQVQALGVDDFIGPAKEIGKKGLDWVNKQRETTIIIENYSSKELKKIDDADLEKLNHSKDAKWIKKSPPTIAAAKDGTPGKVTIVVKTDKLIRGVTRADTSGFVEYEIVDEGKSSKVRIAWISTGGGKLGKDPGWSTESGRYEVEAYQSNPDELTFSIKEVAPVPTPKQPQPAEDTKPKESKAAASKLEYTIMPFVTGKFDKLESGSILEHSHKIWNEIISDETKTAILRKLPAGQLSIEVHGYTSNTDAAERNLLLSEKRAKAVIEALKKVGVPATAFTDPQPHGEWQTTDATDDKKKEKEDPNWRKVVVKVSQ